MEDPAVPPDDPDWTEIPGWFAPREGLLLQAAVRNTPEDAVLVELGTWCGRSAACAAEAAGQRRIYTVDSYAEGSQAATLFDSRRDQITPAAAREWAARVLDPLGVQRVDADAIETASRFAPCSVALIFIDDHHEAAHTLRVLAAWLPKLTPLAFVLLHDWTLFGLADACEPALRAAGFRMDAQAFTLARWRRSTLAPERA